MVGEQLRPWYPPSVVGKLIRGLGASACAAFVMMGAVSDAKAQNAEALFDQGLKAMLDGRYETGCPDIERSYGLDPLPGALFTLAACYERWGKVHTATGHYEKFVSVAKGLPAAERAKQEKRVATAKDKLAALRPQVPTLQLVFASPPSDDVLVTLDGQSVSPAELGQDRPIDPGEHQIEVRAGSGGVEEMTVRIDAGQTRTVTLQLPDSGGAGAAGPDDGSEDEGSAGGWTGMHTGAVVAGGLGVVGLVIGGVTGGMVLAKKSEVDDSCVDGVCRDEAGKEAADDAKSLASVSDITFVVGGVALAGGIVLWLLAPSLDEPDAETAGVRLHVGGVPGDPGSAVVGLTGSF
jgi:hypothetical protein